MKISFNSISKYNTLESAKSARLRTALPSKWSIILGDNNLFWVVTNREADYLTKNGYELAQ